MHTPRPNRLRWAAACALAGATSPLWAQVIDELSLRRDGRDAVLTVRLATPLQFRRSVATGAEDLLQVYYDALPSRERPRFLDGERRQLVMPGLPRISVSEDGSGQDLVNRKLVIRSEQAVRMKARAGQDNRSIDITLDGLGELAARALAPLPPSAPEPAGDAAVAERARQLLGAAQDALVRGEADLAIEQLNEALNLPPNPSSADAQAAIAQARLARGDRAGAQREAELYLRLHPTGSAARRMQGLLAELGGGAAPAPLAQADTPDDAARRQASRQLSGAWSQYFYGGASKSLTQLKDTPLDGQVPQIISESTLSGIDQKQLASSVDLNWRERSDSRELRAGFRDNHTYELMADRPSRNRLTAAYVDWRELPAGWQARAGRQSGLGGGVLGRFDGLQASWSTPSHWKFGAVAGQPTDDLLDSRRWFAGASVELEARGELPGGSLYAIQQQIDGEVDRRALGLDLRWFSGSNSVFSQLEYDAVLKGLNVAALQATRTLESGTTFNLMADYRAVPLLMLGNALFFADPTITPMPRTLTELLRYRSLAELRQMVGATTAYSKQALAGVTKPIDEHWQVGADLRLTSVGAIAPVPGILPQGLPASGRLWSGTAQLIGSNLYSERDTHVASLTLIKGPQYSGWLASYNHLSEPWTRLQFEPSLRLYGQNGPSGVHTLRWSPGLRLAWRGGEKWTIEGEVSAESSRTTGPTQNEHGNRVYYYLGYRLEL